MGMDTEKVLITVKTYPTLSKTHVELVCIAGLREDGSWIRLYPIPFRLLDEGTRFTKWQWVRLPVARRTKDHRQESFSPADLERLEMLEKIGKRSTNPSTGRFVQGAGGFPWVYSRRCIPSPSSSPCTAPPGGGSDLRPKSQGLGNDLGGSRGSLRHLSASPDLWFVEGRNYFHVKQTQASGRL